MTKQTITQNWRDVCVVTFNGSSDTHKYSGGDYNTLALGDLFAMRPGFAEKTAAPAIIPSTYAAWDARTHEVQRSSGKYAALTLDMDSGNLDGGAVMDALRGFAGDDCAVLVYSSSSSSVDAKKWRGIIPLSGCIGFEQWEQLQHGLYWHVHCATGVRPDYALARAGQPVFLPNVPRARRGDDGAPLFWQRIAQDGAGLDLAWPSVCESVRFVREEAARIEQQHNQARDVARLAVARRVANYGGDGESALDLVARYNQGADVANLLAANGYVCRGSSNNWRSPYQSSGTYATRDFGGYWVSLSESDAMAGVGRRTAGSASMCFGDAFDLFCHFDHGNDFKAAIKALAAEARSDRRSDFTRFEPESTALDDFAAFIEPVPISGAVSSAADDFAAFISADDGVVARGGRAGPPITVVGNVAGSVAALKSAMERMDGANLDGLLGEIPAYVDGLHGIDRMALNTLASHYKDAMRRVGVKIGIADAREKITNAALVRSEKEAQKMERANYQQASHSSEMLRDWVYLEDDEKFVNLRDGRKLSSKSFDMVYAKDVPEPPEGERPRPAHQFFALQEGRSVYTEMYVPSFWRDGDGGQFFTHELRHYINGFHGHLQPKAATDWDSRPYAARVRDHVVDMMGSEAEANLIIHWMAHNVQYPGLKILWAPIILGPQGCGKTTIFEAVGSAIGKDNAQTINMAEVYSEFSGWATGACVRAIEEIRIVGHSRHDLMNKMKPYITNNKVKVVFKGRDGIDVLNTQNYICFTNFPDAIVLDEEDRRYAVMSTSCKTRDDVVERYGEQYFIDLYEAINDHQGDVRGWLMGVDLTGFSRLQAPPMTRAKLDMIAATRGDDVDNLEAVVESGGMGISKDVVSTSHINTALRLAGFPTLSSSRLRKALDGLGFEQFPKVVKFDGKTCRVAIRGAMAERVKMADSDMLAALIPTLKSAMAVSDFT